MASFFSHFVRNQGKQALAAITTELVKFNPDAAIKADIDKMVADLDAAGRVIAEMRTTLSREQKEHAAARERYNAMVAGAEHIKKQIADPGLTGDRRTELESSLGRLLDRLDQEATVVDRERKDVDDLQAQITDAETLYQQKATGLREARHNAERARNDMRHAGMQEERSRQRAEQAEVIAGLKDSPTSQIATATNLMQKAAEDARTRAEAHDMKANALRSSDDASEDPNVAAAMEAARNEAVPARSLDDRLSALRRK